MGNTKQKMSKVYLEVNWQSFINLKICSCTIIDNETKIFCNVGNIEKHLRIKKYIWKDK